MPRQYTAPDFGVRDTRDYRASGVAQADTRVVGTVEVGDSGWRARLVEGLGGTASKVLDNLADVTLANAYLEGQAQVGIAKSEAELQGNFMTRDWKVAGYRDTMGKLALADAEATFKSDLKTLRTKSSEDMGAYLDERRAKLLPQLGSMSRDARAAMAGQLMLQDRAATSTWEGEHFKYVIEQKVGAAETAVGVALQTLTPLMQQQSLTGDVPSNTYIDAVRSAAGTIVGAVWADEGLPRDVRQEITARALQNVLKTGNTDLYDYLADPIHDKEGTSLVARLTGDQQLQLSSAYAEADNAKRSLRNMDVVVQTARITAELDAGVSTLTAEGLAEFTRRAVASRAMTSEQVGSLWNKFYDAGYKKETAHGVLDALRRGDHNYIANAGKTEQEALVLLNEDLAKNRATPEQRIDAYIQAGRGGSALAFKSVGEMLAPALQQLANAKDGQVLPQVRAITAKLDNVFGDLEGAALTSARVSLLSGLDADDRAFMQRVMAQQSRGKSHEEAVKFALQERLAEQALSPAAKAGKATAMQKLIDANTESMNLVEKGWAVLRSMVGSTSGANDLKLRPRSEFGDATGWFGDSPAVGMAVEQMARMESRYVSEEMLVRSGAPEDIREAARAAMVSNTFHIRDGTIPVTMPPGSDFKQALGVAPAQWSMIGPAIDTFLKPTKRGGMWVVTPDERGGLVASEYDSQGTPIGQSRMVHPQEIQGGILKLLGDKRKRANELIGTGKSVQTETGTEIKYSGVNTAGVNADWMLGFRDNLVKSEGVRTAVYDDATGKALKPGETPKGVATVGIGVSSRNPHYPKVQADGTVLPVHLTASFNGATNDAARAGARYAKNVGLDTREGFNLMAELAYHSGTAFLTQQNSVGKEYRTFAGALQAKDLEAAQAAFKDTAAWRAAGASRKTHYLKMIEAALK